jgi:hypothetical protein
LTKIDNLLGLLSTGSSGSFDDRVTSLQNNFQNHGVPSVIKQLIDKKETEALPTTTTAMDA